MVDSVKNYGLTGVSANVEIGKGGPRVIGNSDYISIMADNTSQARANIADGTNADHAVSKSQLDALGGTANKVVKATVNYNSGTVTIGTTSANTHIHSVSVEKGTGNWSGANATTEITVGDDGDVDRLYSGFDISTQTISRTMHHYTSATDVKVYVTQGGASAGTATVLVTFTGEIS